MSWFAQPRQPTEAKKPNKRARRTRRLRNSLPSATLPGLKSIVGGGVVQVVDQALDSGAVWGGTAQLLDGKANVLVGAGAAADVAGGAGGDEQSLASNDLLLGQGGGLALVVDLGCPKSVSLK